jgi:cell wall assembly regulator SMI1
MESDRLIEAWRASINDPDKSWVLFENGTCVILMESEADLAVQATNLLREFGPVHAGSPAGDFSTITLENGRGWVVTCHHNDILIPKGFRKAVK